MQDAGSWLLALSNPLCADTNRVGGKAAELHWLCENGFPVPAACVVTQAAFERYFPGADPEAVPAPPLLEEAFSAALRAAYRSLTGGGSAHIVVRSSALAEDGRQASFAGQHATYYYVDEAALPKAVTDCWLSLWSEQARAYRRALGQRDAPFGMAVILQQMVQAERAGVCFTEDPTGARPGRPLIEACWGLGAALVDGRVSPDRYWLTDTDTVLEQRIGRKRLKVAEKLNDPSDRRLEPVPLSMQTRPVLTAELAERIGGTARRIARLKGEPQDMEWAVADGRCFVLQTRPVTGMHATVEPPIPGRWILFKPLIENFSEPFTPMSADLLRRALPPIGAFIHGWVYLDFDLIRRLLPTQTSDSELAKLLLLRESPGRLRWRLPAALRSLSIAALGYLCFGASWVRAAHAPLGGLAVFEARCREVLSDPESGPLDALQSLVFNRHPLRPIGEFPLQVNVAAARYFIELGALRWLLRRFAPEFDPAKTATLCAGGEGMISRRMVEQIRSMGSLAACDPRLERALRDCNGDAQALLEEIGEAHPFTIALSAFLAEFGHRTIRELELSTPRWREDPTAVINMIRAHLSGEAAAAAERTGDRAPVDPHALYLATRDELHQLLPSRWRRALVDHLVQRIRRNMTMRENSRHYHAMIFAAVRQKLKTLEQRLLQDGRLRCTDDVFFLEYPEALDLQDGRMDWRDVEPIVRARRLSHQRRALERAPEVINLDLEGPARSASGHPGLRGDCASPGAAEGIARVILDPGVGAELRPGEILIAPYTDPAWTPLFPAAGGIVVEIGSYLSHAGTVAREYRIPCLVDVSGCTRMIRTGQRVRLNASEGWVEVLE